MNVFHMRRSLIPCLLVDQQGPAGGEIDQRILSHPFARDSRSVRRYVQLVHRVLRVQSLSRTTIRYKRKITEAWEAASPTTSSIIFPTAVGRRRGRVSRPRTLSRKAEAQLPHPADREAITGGRNSNVLASNTPTRWSHQSFVLRARHFVLRAPHPTC